MARRDQTARRSHKACAVINLNFRNAGQVICRNSSGAASPSHGRMAGYLDNYSGRWNGVWSRNRAYWRILASSLSDGSLFVWLIVAKAVAVQRNRNPAPESRDDPIKRQVQTRKTAFVARMPSDSDHASYVKWRRNRRFRQAWTHTPFIERFRSNPVC